MLLLSGFSYQRIAKKSSEKSPSKASFYELKAMSIDNEEISFEQYRGKKVLIVNVATKCGYTYQYEGMQTIWEKYESKGIIMLGVPSNDFGNQEPGNNKDIKNFCEAKFGITFPMTEKVSVKGEKAHPFYKWARKNYGKGAIPKWNFHKIIIGKDGKIEDTFASITKPSSKKFIQAIEKALK